MKKLPWILFVVFCLIGGTYPFIMLIMDQYFGILNWKSSDVLASQFYLISFYAHIVSGGAALTIGWVQFIKEMRIDNPRLHRSVGKAYIISVGIGGVTGFIIAWFAHGGLISSIGFDCLAILWLYTTYKGYSYVRGGQISKHQEMMYYSYALTFAAVTFRILTPLLDAIMGNEVMAYRIAAWLSWILNLAVAYSLLHTTKD